MKKIFIPCIVFSFLFIASSHSQIQETIIIPDDAHSSQGFGMSVAMDSVRAIIGAIYDNIHGGHSGSAYVFIKEGDNWQQEQKLVPSDGEAGGEFGWAVAISGEDILIGEPQDSENGLNAGAVYHFQFNPESSEWYEKEKITPQDAFMGDMFGSSISISEDYAIIGARGVNGTTGNDGAAYIYQRRDGSWTEAQKLIPAGIVGEAYFGNAVSMDGDFAIVGSYSDNELGKDAGAAYIFHNKDDTWTQMQKLAGNDTDKGDIFGLSVSLSGEYAAVSGINVFGTSGVVYVFKYDQEDDIWEQDAWLTDTSIDHHVSHGFSISIEEDYLLAGVRHDDTYESNSGALCLYKRTDNDWHLVDKIFASRSVQTAQLGYSVYLYDNLMIGGAPHYYSSGEKVSGGAYIFTGLNSYASIEDQIPSDFKLEQNYPNPFNSSTTIPYSLSTPGYTSLIIFNALGVQQEVLINEYKPAGNYDVLVQTKDLAPGLYFYRLFLDHQVIGTRKMFKIK